MSSILYEVVITVTPQIRSAYLEWLKSHIEQMMRIDGLLSAEILTNTENENEISCYYRLRNQAAMDAYLAGPAQDMRADGVNRFGNAFSARRRILCSFLTH
ncbi:MAG: DUF4286 family protein [Pseudomonadota bacterium]